MIYRAVCLATAIAFIAVCSPVSAQSLVECPASRIDARITTKLPNDWWSTPQSGDLVGTEVAKVGKGLALICLYRVFGTEVGVMQQAPANMGCSARPTGFECSRSVPQTASSSRTSVAVSGGFRTDPGTVIKDNSVKVQGGISGGPPGKVVVDIKRPDAGTADTGKGPSVRYGGSCADPMLNGIEVRYLSVEPRSGEYQFRLVGIVENAGRANYNSSPGQQRLELYELRQGSAARSLRNWDFPYIPGGGEAPEATYDVTGWRLTDRFPPVYRFSITYGPDIAQDGNQSNDDCNPGNNSTSISGEDINAIIRASGI